MLCKVYTFCHHGAMLTKIWLPSLLGKPSPSLRIFCEPPMWLGGCWLCSASQEGPPSPRALPPGFHLALSASLWWQWYVCGPEATPGHLVREEWAPEKK